MSIFNLRWGAYVYPILAECTPPKITIKSTIQHLPLFKSKSFLGQKYVVESLSIHEIADMIKAANSRVHKYLKLHGIPMRESGSKIQKRAGRELAYGRKMLERSEIEHKRELETVAKMLNLRHKGFSYWKVADVLNALKIPTKTWSVARTLRKSDIRCLQIENRENCLRIMGGNAKV